MAGRKRKDELFGGDLRRVPLGDLVLNDANPRQHPARSIEQLKRSLRRFGQRAPIVVQREGMVVRAGNGRVMAARELGWEDMVALVVDESSVEAAAFAIMDNRAGEMSLWDEKALIDQLLALQRDKFDLELTGFSEDELAGLLHGPNDPAEEWRGMPEFAEEDQEAWKTLKVHFADEAAYAAFADLVGQSLGEKTRSIWYPKAEVKEHARYRYEDAEPDGES